MADMEAAELFGRGLLLLHSSIARHEATSIDADELNPAPTGTLPSSSIVNAGGSMPSACSSRSSA